jgi:hypothetical protein
MKASEDLQTRRMKTTITIRILGLLIFAVMIGVGFYSLMR